MRKQPLTSAPTLRGNKHPLQSPSEVAELDPRILRDHLREAEERLGFVLESIKDYALLLLDVDGIITGWSAGAEKVFGYSEKEILGQQVHRIFTAEDNGCKIPELEMKLSRNEGRATDDRWHIRKDGSLFWATGYMRPLFLFETDKKLRGYAKMVRDLTAVKQVEDELKQLNQKLEARVATRTRELAEANEELRKQLAHRKSIDDHLLETNKSEAIGRLAGGVAHDFNNLITGILGITTALTEETQDPHWLQELAEIMKAGQQASLLTRQLLAIGRQQVVTLQVINLNDLISEALPFYKRLLREDIELIPRLDPALHNVKANAGQFQQVLNNLLLNAQDAMPNGGKLEIQTSNVALDATYRKHHFDIEPGNYVALSVSDCGYGMDAKTLEHIFDPFFTTKEVGKGSGLGLAAVYGIVGQSGGDIEVTSQLDIGTTIRIYLPQGKGGTTVERSGAERRARKGGGETILVVEDDDLVRRVTTRMLAKAGYRVLEAENAKSAIDQFNDQANKIDLMLTDVVMPGMNGRELAAELTEKWPDIAVLYTSGHSRDVVLNRGIQNSSIEFIAKPFSAESLSLHVRKVLDKRTSRFDRRPSQRK